MRAPRPGEYARPALPHCDVKVANTGESDCAGNAYTRAPREFRIVRHVHKILLQRPVALRIVGLALVAALSLLLLRFGRIGLLAAGFLAVLQGAYAAAFAVNLMGRCAQGFVRSAASSVAGSHADVSRTSVLLAVGVAMVALVGAVHLLPLSLLPVWLLLTALVALALPAAIVSQVLNSRLGSAVIKGSLLELAARIDRQYLRIAAAVLCVALSGAALLIPIARAGGLVSMLSAAAAGQPAAAGAAQMLLAFVLAAVAWCLVFLLCALTGRAMYLQAAALGIAVIGPGDARDAVLRPIDQDKRLRDDALQRMVAAGDVRTALKQVHDELSEKPQSLVLHARLYRLLTIEGYRPRIEDQAEKYLHLLLASGNHADALALADEALVRDPQWRPRNVDDTLPLAQAAFVAGQSQLAAHLIKGFDRRHREHPHIPAAYLLGAKLLMLQGEPEQAQARAVLEHLSASFPQSQAALDGQPLLDALDEWDRQRADAAHAEASTSFDRAD